jgi:hypothetical protein
MGSGVKFTIMAQWMNQNYLPVISVQSALNKTSPNTAGRWGLPSAHALGLGFAI